jgi:hypothetical protein
MSSVEGQSYEFRVAAKYQNGFTDYSPISLPVWACFAPMGLTPVRLLSVSRTQMTLQWS